MIESLIFVIVVTSILRPLFRKDITRPKKPIDTCDTLPIYHQAKMHRSRKYRKALKSYIKRNKGMVDFM